MRFPEDKPENDYRREAWSTNKRLAIYSSLFYFIHWILIIALSTRPLVLSDMIFFYGVGCLISVPLPFLVIFDYPEKNRLIYQAYITVCVWAWSYYVTIYMYACDFYQIRGPSHCGQRDFIGVLLYVVQRIICRLIFMFGLFQFCHCPSSHHLHVAVVVG